MMSPRAADYEHVLRIAVVFVLGAAAFLVWRAWMVPDDFGVYGHYRAGALNDARQQPFGYAGQATCADCHGDVVEVRLQGGHAAVACEACHGPLNAHASGDADTGPPLPAPRDTCLTCHQRARGKPATFPQIAVDEHAPEGACTACHPAHAPGLS